MGGCVWEVGQLVADNLQALWQWPSSCGMYASHSPSTFDDDDRYKQEYDGVYGNSVDIQHLSMPISCYYSDRHGWKISWLRKKSVFPLFICVWWKCVVDRQWALLLFSGILIILSMKRDDIWEAIGNCYKVCVEEGSIPTIVLLLLTLFPLLWPNLWWCQRLAPVGKHCPWPLLHSLQWAWCPGEHTTCGRGLVEADPSPPILWSSPLKQFSIGKAFERILFERGGCVVKQFFLSVVCGLEACLQTSNALILDSGVVAWCEWQAGHMSYK